MRALDEVFNQIGIQGWQGYRAVRNNFHGCATGTKGNNRTEHRIIGDADHQFTAVLFHHHGLNGDAIDVGRWPQAFHVFYDFMVSRPHRRRIGQVQYHPTDIGLVGDVWRVDFHGHRKPQLLGNQ